jgi:TrmH family RNA methyltransferase
MKNMGQRELALVSPRYFPHPEASARASGAEDILESALLFDNLRDAVADCILVAGSSARSRAIDWPQMRPRECAARLAGESRKGRVAIVFGPEKSGLTNEHLDLCQVLLTIPTDPSFSSLNLAMAVQVMAYELRLAFEGEVPESDSAEGAATNEELEYFYEHLQAVLTGSGFLDPQNPRLLMRRLRRLFVRAELSRDEVNILRGILTSLEPVARSDRAQ